MEPAISPADAEIDWTRLIEAARRGDELALAELYEQLSSYLWLTADRGLASDLRAKVAASDIVQQTLMEAHAKIETFEGSRRDQLQAWLRQILQNNLTDVARRYHATHCRDTSRERPLGDGSHQFPSTDPTASVYARREETDQELWCAITELPERSQRVIELRHREELSYAEIGKQFDISEVAARKLWSRAVEQLRTILSPADADRSSKPR